MNRRSFLQALVAAPAAAALPAAALAKGGAAQRKTALVGEIGPESIMPKRKGIPFPDGETFREMWDVAVKRPAKVEYIGFRTHDGFVWHKAKVPT